MTSTGMTLDELVNYASNQPHIETFETKLISNGDYLMVTFRRFDSAANKWVKMGSAWKITPDHDEGSMVECFKAQIDSFAQQPISKN
jgi:hypothetical protein